MASSDHQETRAAEPRNVPQPADLPEPVPQPPKYTGAVASSSLRHAAQPEPVAPAVSDPPTSPAPPLGEQTDHLTHVATDASSALEASGVENTGFSANTAKAYETKQREFQEYCGTQSYLDGAIVTEAKIIGFMNDVVLPRAAASQRGSNNGSQASDTQRAASAAIGQLSWSSIKQYRSAIVNLWKEQAIKGENHPPHPVPALLDLLKPFRPTSQKPSTTAAFAKRHRRSSMPLPGQFALSHTAPMLATPPASARMPPPATFPQASGPATMNAVPSASHAIPGMSTLTGVSAGESATSRTADKHSSDPVRPSSPSQTHQHQHSRSYDLDRGFDYPQPTVESVARKDFSRGSSHFSDDSYLGHDSSFQESVMDALNVMREEQRGIKVRQERLANLVQKEFADLRARLEVITSGRVQFFSPDTNSNNPSNSAGNVKSAAATPVSTANTRFVPMTAAQTAPKIDAPIQAASPAFTAASASASASFSAAGPRPSMLLAPKAHPQPSEPTTPATPATPATPIYRLSRSIRRVPDLWREWTVGLTGQPSVEALDSMYGASWRASSPERMFYSRRKAIIDAVKDIVRKRKGVRAQAARTADSSNGNGHGADGSGEEAIVTAAVQYIEEMRMRRKMSLDALSKVLMRARQKKKRKELQSIDEDIDMEEDTATDKILEEEGMLVE